MILALRRVREPFKHLGRLLNGNNFDSKTVLSNNSLIRKQIELGVQCSSIFLHTFSPIYQQSAVAAENSSESEEPDKLFKLIEVEVRGNDKAVLKSYTQFATSAAEHLGVEIGKCWTPDKPDHERFTVLKSIHVNKKNMVQYEFRTYYRFMQFHKLTGSTADTFLEYIQRNLPEGVAMKVTKIGLEKLPSHLKPPAALKENSKQSESI